MVAPVESWSVYVPLIQPRLPLTSNPLTEPDFSVMRAALAPAASAPNKDLIAGRPATAGMFGGITMASSA